MKLFKSKSEKIRDRAYHSLIESLPLRRRTVYNIIKSYGALTSEQIADKMRLRLNEVSGRVTELHQQRLIKYKESRKSLRSHLNNCKWEVTTPRERDDLLKIDLIIFRKQITDLEENKELVLNETTEILIIKELNRLNKRLKLIK